MVSSPGQKDRDAGTIRSVLRALDVLEVLADSGASSSISELSEATGIPGPTVFRLLNTLLTRGYAIKTSKREYTIGPAFFAFSASAGFSLGSAMNDILKTLVEETNESASVAMRERESALYVSHKPSPQAMRLFTTVGNRVPLHATGVGKALMAAMPDNELGQLLPTLKYVKFTDNTLGSAEELHSEIEHIRVRGFAYDNEEQEIGVRCAAMAVPTTPGFAISISGPPSRMSDAVINDVALPALRKAVTSLTNLLESK